MKISGAVTTGGFAAVAALFLFISLNLPAHTSWAQEKIKQPITQKPAALPGPKPVEKKDPGPAPVQSAPASPAQAQSPPSSPAATLDFELEMKRIEALIRVNDKNGEAYFNRACLYELKGDTQKAVEDYSKAIAIDKGMKDALYNRALLFSKGKKYEEALKDLSEVIKLDPSALDALCNRGSIHFQTGKMDLAVADYSAGLKIAPGDADLLYNRALAYLAKNEKEAAAQDLKKSAGFYHDRTRKEFPELSPQPPPALKKAAFEGRVVEFLSYMPADLVQRVQGFDATRIKVEKAMLELESKAKQLFGEKVRRQGNTLAFPIIGTDPRWAEVFGPKWPEMIKQSPKEPRFFYLSGEFAWKEEIQVVQHLQACLENPSLCRESAPPNSALQLKRLGGVWTIVDGKKAEEWKQAQAMGDGIAEILQWAGKFMAEKKGKGTDEEMLVHLAKEYVQKVTALSKKK